jgi:dephospho-CoA kinase
MSSRQIGITGGIGSGKSLVCKIFECLGVPVYDADSRAKHLMVTDDALIAGIKKEFGSEAYHQNGTLNREFISRQTFGFPERLEKLNKIVHPRVALAYEKWVKDQASHRYVVKEAALLFETGSAAMLDKVIVVSAPVALRVRRVLQRDPWRNEEDVKKIIDSQMSQDEKEKRADFIVINDESQLLIPQILKLHRGFLGSQS